MVTRLRVYCFLFLAFCITSCSLAGSENGGLAAPARKDFLAELDSEMSRLYAQTGSPIYDKTDACDAAKPLRQLLDMNPSHDADVVFKSDSPKYLALSLSVFVLPGETLTEEAKSVISTERRFEYVDGATDHINCGEQYYLTSYASWYASVFNDRLFALEQSKP